VIKGRRGRGHRQNGQTSAYTRLKGTYKFGEEILLHKFSVTQVFSAWVRGGCPVPRSITGTHTYSTDYFTINYIPQSEALPREV